MYPSVHFIWNHLRAQICSRPCRPIARAPRHGVIVSTRFDVMCEHAALRQRHDQSVGPATAAAVGAVWLVPQLGAVVPVEPHRQRARPNPTLRTLVLASSSFVMHTGRRRCTINGVSLTRRSSSLTTMPRFGCSCFVFVCNTFHS
jgi:hypothetical protein